MGHLAFGHFGPFVKFWTAFHSIDRGKLMEIVKVSRIPTKKVSVLNVLHTNTVAQIISVEKRDFLKSYLECNVKTR